MDEARITAMADRVASKLRVGRFPPKAVDANKLTDPDGFWELPVSVAERSFAISLRPKDIGDVIFFLNMAADGWEMHKAGKIQLRK